MQEPQLISVDGIVGGGVIEDMKAEFDLVAIEAACRGQEQNACMEDNPDCEFHASTFCSRKLAAARVVGERIDLEYQLEREKDNADVNGIPRRLRSLLRIGQRDGRERMVESEAIERLIEAQPFKLAVISGNTGTGKSVAAAWWATKVGALFYPAMRITWWSRIDHESLRLLSVPFAVIDGLDQQWAKKDGTHQRNIRHVLNERYDAMLPTVVTTDLMEPEFLVICGYRWKDVMRQDGRFLRLASGRSMRGTDPAAQQDRYNERERAAENDEPPPPLDMGFSGDESPF